MHRWIGFAVCLAGLGVMALASRADTQVDYRDPKAKSDKLATVRGEVKEESVAGIKIQPPTGAVRDVPASDIVRVTYDVPGKFKLDYPTYIASEEKRDFAKALAGYQGMLPGVPDNSPLKRHLEFRIAMLKAELADDADEGAKKQAQQDAIEALTKFIAAHPNSWQLTAAVRQTVRLQMDAGAYAAAEKTLDALAKADNLPKEVKQEVDLMTVDLLMQQPAKAAEAEAKVGALLASLPANDPLRGRLEVYQIGAKARTAKLDEVVNKLETVIANSKDNGLKALAYNTLGDCYKAQGKSRDAMWSYLWVDQVYNQDRLEHAKALDRLTKLFTELNDEKNANRFKEKLAKVR
jgi:tetratricopeptide (TPR) repeat protein